MKIYHYAKCSSCRDALKFLDQRGVDYTAIEIDQQPPSKADLREMLKWHHGNIRRLFNTSGLVYKALGLKDKLPNLTEDQALELLSANGKLVKRPFVLGKKFGLLGFDKDEWSERF